LRFFATVYQFKWIAYNSNNKIFEAEFTIEMQYNYSGGFELNKITNINIQKYIDKKSKIIKACEILLVQIMT